MIVEVESGITHCTFSQQSDKVLTTSLDETSKLWDIGQLLSSASVESITPKAILNHPSEVYFAEFSADGSTILTCGLRPDPNLDEAGIFMLWDTATLEQRINKNEAILSTRDVDGVVRQCQFNVDNTYVLTVPVNDYSALWSTRNLKLNGRDRNSSAEITLEFGYFANRGDFSSENQWLTMSNMGHK